MTLEDLYMNEMGIIQKINIKGKLKRRLLDFGLIKDTKIKPVLRNMSGSLRAYEIRGALIAIRNEDAKQIVLKKYNTLI